MVFCLNAVGIRLLSLGPVDIIPTPAHPFVSGTISEENKQVGPTSNSPSSYKAKSIYER